jgi:hypothetical protein
MNLIEQGRSVLQAQSRTFTVTQLFIAHTGTDGKQLIHQSDEATSCLLSLMAATKCRRAWLLQPAWILFDPPISWSQAV